MSAPRKLWTRRSILGVGLGAATTLVAACASGTPSAPTTAPATTSAPATSAPAASSGPAATPTTSPAPAATAQPSQGAKTLTYWSWWAPTGSPSFTTWWNFIKADYEAKFPGNSFNLQIVPFADYVTKYLGAAAAGSVGDAMHTSVAWARDFWARQTLADLTSYSQGSPDVAPDKFFAAAKFYTQDAGKIFGVATEGPAGYSIAYNLDHFNEVGLPTDTTTTWAWTWDDFVNAARKLTKSSGGTIQRSGFLVTDPAIEYLAMWLYSEGGQFYSPDFKSVAFDNDKGTAVLQLWSDLLNKDKVSAPIAPNRSDSQLFYSGQASMIIFGMYLINDTGKNAPNLKYNFMPIPKGAGGNGPAAVIFFNMETIPAKSQDKDLAWQWVTYYAGPTIQAALPAQISFPSPRQDVYESDAWKNAVQKIPQNANVPKISALPGVGPYPFVRYSALSDAIHPILQKVVPLGTLSPKDAIAQAAQKGNAVLSQGTS